MFNSGKAFYPRPGSYTQLHLSVIFSIIFPATGTFEQHPT